VARLITVGIDAETLGSSLAEVMLAPDITPGDDVSYQTCKTLFLFHPLGWKMVCAPLQLAMSEARAISVPDSPGERAVEAYRRQWQEINADAYIFQTMAMSRVYGIASCALLAVGKEPNEFIDPFEIPDLAISFNVYDPLNTSGSLILNQQPTALDFMHSRNIAVQMEAFHRSRSVTVMNEFPVYLSWTPAAFGFVGRSVYQRAFYPMKSYLMTMIADNMIETKVGVIVAKVKQATSAANAVTKAAAWFKRSVVREAETTNVINITPEEAIESLNLQNMDAPHALARRNIMENIATAADMPIKLLAQEAFVEGFGEGVEDAKAIARYIERVRRTMQPLVDYFDRITQLRAWTPAFYAGIQKDFPEQYGGVAYKEAFYQWVNSFAAVWPSLLKEPDSEEVKLDDVKLKAVIALIQVFEPVLDSVNKLALYQWAQDNINSNKIMFTSPLELDYEALASHLDEMEQQQADQQQAGGDEGGKVGIKMSKADSLAARFGKAAELLGKSFPDAEDVIPIGKIKDALKGRQRA
jgi:hypothetical protein